MLKFDWFMEYLLGNLLICVADVIFSTFLEKVRECLLIYSNYFCTYDHLMVFQYTEELFEFSEDGSMTIQ